jgi:hypothetical protein
MADAAGRVHTPQHRVQVRREIIGNEKVAA